MSTTNLFVEFIIIGFQTLIWVVLLFLNFINLNKINIEFNQGIDTAAAFIIILIPIVYPIGVIVDHLSDQLLRRFHYKIRDSIVKDRDDSYISLVLSDIDIRFSDYLEYMRTKIRLGRSTGVNAIFILIFGQISILSHVNLDNGKLALTSFFFIFLMLVIAVSSFWTWSSGTKTYYKNLKKGYTFKNGR